MAAIVHIQLGFCFVYMVKISPVSLKLCWNNDSKDKTGSQFTESSSHTSESPDAPHRRSSKEMCSVGWAWEPPSVRCRASLLGMTVLLDAKCYWRESLMAPNPVLISNLISSITWMIPFPLSEPQFFLFRLMTDKILSDLGCHISRLSTLVPWNICSLLVLLSRLHFLSFNAY